ncbi:MAG: zinc-dependent metalloprotease, partial [Bacteroidota bacterium]
MKQYPIAPLGWLLFLALLLCSLTDSLHAQANKKPTPSVETKVKDLQAFAGFFDFYWSEDEGKIYLEIDRWDEDFLYVNSLSAGVGSNDIGLDRNQLGDNRVVRWHRAGPKVLLLERNLNYRAISDNIDERQSVEDAFAQAVLGGFKVEARTGEKVLIDLTPMLMVDAHGVANRLKSRNQGMFKVDKSRSIVHLPRTKNFPKNSEFEALLTFAGEARGNWLRSVTATSSSFSVRQHHSFVELPDDDFEPRAFDPRSGYFNFTYADYATPIDQPLVKRFIRKHRLKKKNPAAASSEAVEPIVYYLDRGAPEPIRSALIEGASWWNQAFEAAGFQNAFQVRLLPEDADPLDVRYNVINWVHRSTRGWSYGSSVVDPRTGEIIKGHVLLGSLRVRQDFLIAQGLVEAYKDGQQADPRLLEMALARLRQLSAHEVGHTLGLAHNFAASVNDRSSVMDYPHPQLYFSGFKVDFTKAYDTGIGAWDKRTIMYGYTDFTGASTTEAAGLQAIIAENEKLGLQYISDPDARPVGSAHPTAHLWDNGEDAVAELNRLTGIRNLALNRFGLDNIPYGAPVATLENVFVPVYLMHRYQVEAAAKLIGGYNYNYTVREANTPPIVVAAVSQELQEKALEALLETLSPDFLKVPDRIQALLPPQALGYSRDRELFKFYTGGTFDPLAAAEASAEHTLKYLLHPDRLARLTVQDNDGLSNYLQKIDRGIRLPGNRKDGDDYARVVHHRFVQHLLHLAANEKASSLVRAAALHRISILRNMGMLINYEHTLLLNTLFREYDLDPAAFKPAPAKPLPDGSPIGC